MIAGIALPFEWRAMQGAALVWNDANAVANSHNDWFRQQKLPFDSCAATRVFRFPAGGG